MEHTMSESAARVEPLEFRSSNSPTYLWRVSGEPVAVRLSLEVVERLGHEVLENFRSVSARGSEIGGLLLGASASGEQPEILIEGFEAIPCEYARGPLYRLSDADKQRFDAAIHAHREAGSAPVGFFRSHTRRGLSLDPDDLAFLSERFQNPAQVALLVRPFATKASVGGFFLWKDGAIQGEASPLEFPFSAAELGRKQAAEAAASQPKPATRAQVVPIALRRDASNVPDATIDIEIPPPPPPPAMVTQAAPPEAQAEPTMETVVEPAPSLEPAPLPPPEPAVTLAPEPAVALAPEPALEPAPEPAPEPEPVVALAPESEPAPEPAPAPKSEPAPTPKPQAPPVAAEEHAPRTAEIAAPSFGMAAPARANETAETPKRRGGLLIWAGALLAAGLAGATLFVYPGYMRRSPAPTPAAPLSLRAERTSGDLLVTWNRDADAVKTAVKAVLTISDGPQQETLNVDLAQLRNGSVVYTPATPDVSFRLEVTSSDPARSQSEMLRVLKTQSGELSTSKSGEPPAQNKPAQPAPTPAPPTAEAPRAPKLPTRAFNAGTLESPASRLRAARPSDLPEPPPARGAAAAPSVNFAVPAAAPSSLPPAPQPPPTPAPPARAKAEPPARVGGDVQAAELRTRRDPTYPPLARQSRVSGVVQLEAKIGADGRVKEVRVLQGHPMLRSAAADAVKQWTYKPAMLNGQPIESSSRVEVNFVGGK
jgi:protein TonB